MTAKSIAVIGAGPSGLVTAKELLQEGHSVTCFERAPDLGGVFRFSNDPKTIGVWASCRLTSSQLVTSFSDHFPGWEARRPYEHSQLSHGDCHAYLCGYVERFGVLEHVRFGHEIVHVGQLDDRWRVEARWGR